ncbi:hypothetical protein M569_05567, partial [Genlisea aurea]
DCPLQMSHSNFTLAASLCSAQEDRGKCCRYINAIIAISVSRYANRTGDLGVTTSDLSDTCLTSISQTFELYGVSRNALGFCGFGTKIPVKYECQGRRNIEQMRLTPKFGDVDDFCKGSLVDDDSCKKCLNANILYLRNLLGPVDNVTLSTCRDATFAAVTSRVDYASAIDIGSCFFGIQGLLSLNGSSLPPERENPSSSPLASTPIQLPPERENPQSANRRHTRVIGVIGIAFTALAVAALAVLIVLIRRKKRELKDTNRDPSKPVVPLPARNFQDGPPCTFRKFSYKEVKRATDDFSTKIGEGGFGVVYRAEFRDGLVAAVKRMTKACEQAEDEFCRELELLARLHHRHLVALRGFCIEKQDRFLMYEFMANGSLKDHLHSQGRSTLSWNTRIQIAIDVANALEYLHFYCDPPLCHRDIKSSNILLDENYMAKIADFGLAHASKNGSLCFEPVNTDIRGTPGFMDPEYVVTQELTEKSDIYSYGVVLLELITGRQAIQDNKNLIEWSHKYLQASDSAMLQGLVDPVLGGEGFEFDQLVALVEIAKWCTQREGRSRPSIKQVLRLLYESLDPLHGGFVEAVEDDRSNGKWKKGEQRCLPSSSSSTTKSYCSRSYLLETGSPQS